MGIEDESKGRNSPNAKVWKQKIVAGLMLGDMKGAKPKGFTTPFNSMIAVGVYE